MIPFQVMKTSVVGLPLLTAVFFATAGAAATSVWPRRRPQLGFAALLLLVLTVLCGVNDYFDYLPNVGALLGERAQDQASAREVVLATRLAVGRHALRRRRTGMVELVDIPAVHSGFRARSAQVYLPPAWFEIPKPALPVIELLHGTPGAPEDWTRAGHADVTADKWAARHDGLAPIIVMPDVNGAFLADTECIDIGRARAETYLTEDVPQWVAEHLGAATTKAAWVIAGSSEGGYCALDLALRHPDRYGSFVDLSGLERPTFPGDTLAALGGSRSSLEDHTPEVFLVRHPTTALPPGWIEVGANDGATTRATRRVAQVLRAAGADVQLHLLPNAHHTWRVWSRSFADAFPWIAERTDVARSSSTPGLLPLPDARFAGGGGWRPRSVPDRRHW